MGTADPLLRIESLTKVFRRGRHEIRAVQDLSLVVPRGAIYGFLGPNGAGKSTTLRMALGLIHPTQGRVLIGDHDVRQDPLRALRLVGAFVESPSFYNYLSGRRNLEMMAGLSGGVEAKELDLILDRVGLSSRAYDRVGVYSHGMRARLGLAACLLPRPDLMMLDEPTDGLDPHGIREVRDLIRDLAENEGLTVFLSSHLLEEVENLCTHVAIIDGGRLILEDALPDLERKQRRWLVETQQLEQARGVLSQSLNLRVDVKPAGPQALAFLPDSRSPETVLTALVEAGVQVRSYTPEPHWLDRLFLELTQSHEADIRKESA